MRARHDGSRRARQQHIRTLVARQPVSSQRQLAELLEVDGFPVTVPTVNRDIAELGLVKVARSDRHVYLLPEDFVRAPGDGDERLRRLLADIPVTVGRSALTLVLRATPGTASVIARAIDTASVQGQEGTLAGDDTILVLFSDEERMTTWLRWFRAIQGTALESSGRGSAPRTVGHMP